MSFDMMIEPAKQRFATDTGSQVGYHEFADFGDTLALGHC